MIFGRFREDIEIQRATDVLGDAGGITRRWASVSRAWGRIVSRESLERRQGDVVVDVERTTWELRTDETIDETDRIYDGRKAWAIQTIVPDPMGKPVVRLVTELMDAVQTHTVGAFGPGFSTAFE